MTLSEVLVSSVISTVVAGALFASAAALNRSYSAADHYASAQSAQSRLADYLDVDLRRALSFNVDSSDNITLVIPGFYDPAGVPRMPVPSARFADYGTAAQQVSVTYRFQNGAVVRTETRTDRTFRTVVAQDVSDFEVTLTPERRTVAVEVTFQPRFSWFANTGAAARAGTRFSSHTYLRNIRTIPSQSL